MFKPKNPRLFRKGERPWHWKPVGSEKINPDGFITVKTVSGQWRHKHRVMWEEAYGVPPAGHRIKFIDGNRLNVCLENLVAAPGAADGDEKINQDGYVIVRIGASKRWRLKHHVFWEKAHGPIPKGHKILFIDGDKRNFSLDNLIKLPWQGTRSAFYPASAREKIAANKRQKAHVIMADINQELFAQLERLNASHLNKEELEEEICRSKEIISISRKMFNDVDLLVKTAALVDSRKLSIDISKDI